MFCTGEINVPPFRKNLFLYLKFFAYACDCVKALSSDWPCFKYFSVCKRVKEINLEMFIGPWNSWNCTQTSTVYRAIIMAVLQKIRKFSCKICITIFTLGTRVFRGKLWQLPEWEEQRKVSSGLNWRR